MYWEWLQEVRHYKGRRWLAEKGNVEPLLFYNIAIGKAAYVLPSIASTSPTAASTDMIILYFILIKRFQESCVLE